MKKKFKKLSIVVFILLALLLVTSTYFVNNIYYYNSSRSIIKYLIYAGIIFTGLLIVIFNIWGFKSIKKNKTKNYVWFIIIITLCMITQVFVSFNLNKIANSIKKVTNTTNVHSSSLIVLKDSNIKDIKAVKNKKIGIISDENNIDGYIIPNEIIEKEKLKEENLVTYDTYIEMLEDLYDEEIDACFISSSYGNMFINTEGFEDLKTKVTEIYKKEKEINKEMSNNKTLTEPFTILLMGVDGEKGEASFNGDSLMLITFNPNTMNATILSIPRDTLVPIACYKNHARNKINSAAYGGIDCMKKTIENYTGIDIDYWATVNFTGLIDLVDALGGIKVDVPYAFCESSSERLFGKHTIYVEKGLQTLDGKKALAFARNRHPWPQFCPKKYSKYNSNDFIRGQNQQQIVNAILNELKNIRTLKEVYALLDVVGDNINTNIDKETMMTGFDTFKNLLLKSRNIDNEDFVGTQRLYLSGYDKYINKIYYYEAYKQSLKEIVDAMKINLELKEPEMDKDFSFSINKPYVNKQIGKGIYKY